MVLGTLSLFLLLFAQTVEVVIVGLPAKGDVGLELAPAGKADIERTVTVSRVKIEIDRLPPPQNVKPGMNTYVVWTVSPEGTFENIGEMGIAGGKGRLEATTRLDQFAILITAEPHHMVDRPSAAVAYRNLSPRADNVRRESVSVPIGDYDYAELQAAIPSSEAGLPAEARAGFQIAAAAQAERLAPAELRLARIALDTMEEMLKRAAPMDVVAPAANESIRKSQRAFVTARANANAAALETARNDASGLKREFQQLQDHVQKLTTEQEVATDRIRKLESDLDRATSQREQLSLANEAASTRVRRLETELADVKRSKEDLENAAVLRLSDEFFDYPNGTVSSGGVTVLTKIVAAVGLWKNPIRVTSPGNGIDIAKRFFSQAGVPDGRIIIMAER